MNKPRNLGATVCTIYTIFNFPGESLLGLEGEFEICSAGNNWKCRKASGFFSPDNRWTVEPSSSLMVRIVPRITGQRDYEDQFFPLYVKVTVFLDFSLQDSWLDMIVREQKNPSQKIPRQHIFDTLFATTNVNANNLVVVNKLYSVSGQWHLDLLLYSFFSKFEKKDLIIRVHAKSTLYSRGKEYSVTNQIWSDIIKLSVNNPGYPVSLRGSVHAKLTSIADNVSTVLKAYWIADATSKRYLDYCFPDDIQWDLIFVFNNYAKYHKRNNDYTYYFTASQFRYAYTPMKKISEVLFNDPPKTKRLGSWNEANSICKSRGSYLPVFRSKEEQDELMRYLKLVKCTPSVNILYIGLTVNLVRFFYSTV